MKVLSYDNPTNKCPVCNDHIRLPAGCCDNSANLGVCSREEKCDSAFFYCLREYATPPDSDPTRPGLCGFHTSHGVISLANTDGNSIDFSQDTVLGQPNPLKLPGIETTWMVNFMLI